MNIKSRRIIALLLCLVMVFSSIPMNAFGMDMESIEQVVEQDMPSTEVSPEDITADITDETTTEENPTAAEDNPVVEEETTIEDEPAVEEEPATEEEPAVEEEPAIEDEPAVEEEPATEEEPAVEEEPAIEDEPAVEEEPAIEDEPVVEEEPATEEDPAVEEETATEEDPAVEEETATEEEPAVEEETATEDEPAVEEEPATEEEPAVEEEPATEEEIVIEEEIVPMPDVPVLGGAITEQYGIMLLNAVALLGDVTGTVYVSVSYNEQYIEGDNGDPVAYIPVSLSDLQKIDLAEYGLTKYNYSGQITALYLYIYTHENIMGGNWKDEVRVSGDAGSIFFEGGLFGFSDCNLQYYCNGEYPAVDGWGVTADQLVLNDGDFLDIANYTSWDFYGDSATGFHYFLDDEEITHEYTATAGEALTVTLGRSNYGMKHVSDYTVSYGTAIGNADGTVKTGSDGTAEITFAEAGTYYLWVDGGKGKENTNDFVSSPACAKVTVEKGVEVIPGTPVTVTDNVIDITDKRVYNLANYYYADATNIKVSGADVESATEDGTTVYIVLDGATAANATVNIEFGTSLNKCTMSGTTGNVTLQDGKATLSMTLTGAYGNRKGSATYTLNFSLGAPLTEPPTCLQESDSAETYSGVAVDLDLKDYFENASAYYLVENETLTPLEGSSYTFRTFEGGTHTLMFAASNTVGNCDDYVTVTIEVTEIKSGAWLGIETSNGSVNYVLFKDAAGNEIDGLTAYLDGTAINVNVPRGFDPSGKITATFDLTQNSDGLPFITTSNSASGSSAAGSKKFTERATTLSNGAAVFTFYLYNVNPKATNNPYTTYTINYITANEAPVLADDQTAAALAAITADKSFTLDLDGIFVDPNGDSITGWQVSINGADAVSAVVDENNVYTYQTNNAGEYTLVFTALDTYNAVSTATYTVTLTVSDSAEAYNMTVNVPEGIIAPTFYSTAAYEDGVDVLGGTLAAAAGTAADGLVPYVLTIPANYETVSVRADGLGGMSFAAADGASVTLRQVQMSVADYDGKAAESTNTVTYGDYTAVAGDNGWLLVTGQEYTYKANPTDTTLAAASKTETLQTGEGTCTVAIVLGINNPLTITATTGAKVQLYNIDTSKYYAASELKAKIVKDNGDGTTTYSFVGDTKASGSCFVYHVSMDGKIAKSGYLGWGQQNVNVTYTDADKSDTWRLDDYSATGEENSSVADDSVLLNINGQNNLAMSVGDTKTLKAYRIWEIIKISYQNYILTPDFTYEILSGSDVVSLTEAESPSTADGDWMTLTALKEGVAVIEVTYDAMEVTGGSYDGAYGASDPARTGLVVVTVGGADTSVKFGIDCFASMGSTVYSESTPKAWDAEFDTLYFTGADGELELSPAASSEITEVAVSNDKGSSWDILTAEDGVYTAKIVSGNNIIRVTTEEGVAYQVVRGDQVTCTTQIITDLNEDGIIDPGDTVRVTLNGLHTPIPKMAGNYNPGFAGNTDGFSQVHIVYTFDNETVTGPGVQYDFGVNANYIDVTIPEDYTDNTIALNDGYIGVGVIGLTTFADGGDSHRNIPDAGCGTRGNQTTFNTRSILPEITINVAVEESEPTPDLDNAAADAVEELITAIGEVTLENEEAITAARTAYDALTDAQKALVENEAVLIAAEAKIAELKAEAADNAAADAVETLIAAIGEVTLEDEEAITAAREAYDALTEAQKELVENVDALTDAEAKIAELKAAAADNAAADAVETMIEAIGEVTLENEAAITAAREAYDALTETQKALVDNADALTEAEAKIAELKAEAADNAAADAVEAMIAAIGEVTLEDEAAIIAAREAYDALTEAQKALVDNAAALIAAEAMLAELKKPAEEPADWQEVMAKTEAYLIGRGNDKTPGVASIGGEWLILGLVRNGAEADFYDAYYNNVVEYVKDNIDENGRLHQHKSTDNSRVILALTALGYDVTNVGGHNLLQGLSDTKYVQNQGVNGVVWALIALDSYGYEIPANAVNEQQVTREKLIQAILDKQLEDGGWALSGQTPDDMTPMAIQALAPYYEGNADVKEAVDKAVEIMSDMTATTETYAQIIVALSALGIDCEDDELFADAMDNMLASALEDGTFKKSAGSGANQMSTEQAFYAMVAYDRLQNDKTFLYDMSDVEIDINGDPGDDTTDGVTLDPSSATIKVGESVTITAAAPAEAVVVWSSSDESIATVENGKVTGVKAGTVTITAIVGENSATCTVTVEAKEEGGSSGTTGGNDFGLSADEIAGYVYISFEDKAKRRSDELAEMDAKFQTALGTIIGRTKVPFRDGDTIAEVTLRLLDAKGFDAVYQGSTTSSFYLEAIGGFSANGFKYDSFGEFDAGQDSGWMITQNSVFIGQGASEFTVKNNDVIKWQYTCQLGADIGDDSFDRNGGGSGAVITAEDRTAAKGTNDLIAAIGKIDENSAEAIKAARAAYDALTDEQKALVSNYEELLAAEKAYAELTGENIAPADTPYTDVDGHWASEAIDFVYENGLMTGESENSFAPEMNASRAMIAVILHRLAGEPEVDNAASFGDVVAGAWYANAISWAEANNVVGGYEGGKFGPNDAISRAQLAAILYRYAAHNGYNMNAAADLSGFADAAEISEWSRSALAWAVAEGLMNGNTDNTIDPNGNATRAEVATILMRFIEKNAGKNAK